MSDGKREQVAEQCRAVAHMARSLAMVNDDYVAMVRAGQMDELLDIVGRRTAGEMELLGDILNVRDAFDDVADAWMEPVFAEAQRLWPTPSEATQPARETP